MQHAAPSGRKASVSPEFATSAVLPWGTTMLGSAAAMQRKVEGGHWFADVDLPQRGSVDRDHFLSNLSASSRRYIVPALTAAECVKPTLLRHQRGYVLLELVTLFVYVNAVKDDHRSEVKLRKSL